MLSFETYKNLIILSTTPVQLGGQALNANFTYIADALENISIYSSLTATFNGPGNIPSPFYMGGAVVASGTTVWAEVPANGSIIRYTLLADQAGDIVIAVKKAAYSSWPTETSITGGNDPTLSSSQSARDETLTDWTTSVNAGDILQFSVTSASTVCFVQLFLTIQRNF